MHIGNPVGRACGGINYREETLKTLKNIQNAKVCFCSFENQPNALKTFTQGFYIGDYSFDKYKSDKTEKNIKEFFENEKLFGRCVLTVCGGKKVCR